MTRQHHPLGPGRRRHRHPDHGRPEPGANTMNDALHRRRMRRRVDRLAAEKDAHHRRHRHLGQEDLLRRRRPQGPAPAAPRATPPRSSTTAPRSRRSCARWRPSASRSSPRSTAPRSAAASRSRWPATTASRPTPGLDDRPARGDPRPAARRRRRRRAPSACSASPTR